MVGTSPTVSPSFFQAATWARTSEQVVAISMVFLLTA